MSITRSIFGWGKDVNSARMNRSAVDRYPTSMCVTLPDGQLMYVRKASLVAAKDLLAAQHAAERRLAQQRQERMMREVSEIKDEAFTR